MNFRFNGKDYHIRFVGCSLFPQGYPAIIDYLGNFKGTNLLADMDKQHFKSYSNVIAVALVEYFDRYYRSQDDPYLETREREERFVNQIVSSVESAMKKTLPVFLAGCMAGLSQVPVAVVPATQQEPDAELDWDFLGE